MSKKSNAVPPRRTRRLFRWCRIAALLLLLAATLSFVYLDRLGLPDWVKRQLQSELQLLGFDADFEHLRYRFDEGIVAEKVTLISTGTENHPELFAEQLRVKLRALSLLRLDLEIDSMMLAGGRFEIPLSEKGDRPRRFVADKIQTDISFRDDGVFALNNFRASCLGIDVRMSGSLTNGFAVRTWTRPEADSDVEPTWPKFVERIVDWQEFIEFSGTPRLSLNLSGDAENVERSIVELRLQAQGAKTPWGDLEELYVNGGMNQSSITNGLIPTQLRVTATRASTPWGRNRETNLGVDALHDPVSGNPEVANWQLTLDQVDAIQARLGWVDLSGKTSRNESGEDEYSTEMVMQFDDVTTQSGTVESADITCKCEHDSFERLPSMVRWNLNVERLQSEWGSTEKLTSSGQIQPARSAPDPSTVAHWGWWQNLAPFQFQLSASLEDVRGRFVEADRFSFESIWDAPALMVVGFNGELYDGDMEFSAIVDVETRNATLNGDFEFDFHNISHLLTDKGKRWLKQYTWKSPPKVWGQAEIVLPAWTDEDPDWRGEVKPTMVLDAEFEVGEGGFRGVPASSGRSSISFSNMIWRLPDLVITRPEGIVKLEYLCDAKTQDYHWTIDSQVDLQALRSLVDPSAYQALDLLQFSEPVRAQGQVWGRWHHRELTGVDAILEAEKFMFRGEYCRRLKTHATYTNLFVNLHDTELVRDEGHITATAVGIDIPGRHIQLTNAISVVDPMAVARAIGERTVKTIKPYRFGQPPKIVANGKIPFRDLSQVDASFNIEGGPFSFWRFNARTIVGKVDWVGDALLIDDVNARFYDGTLAGNMNLKLDRGKGSTFDMTANVAAADLKKLLRDSISPDNDSEGILSGQLVVTSAKTDDWSSWQGYGNAHLREGSLWDTPLFGLFSHLLNIVYSGLGNSRAGTASANFTIEDSIIRTDDLEILEPTARLQFEGDVDFKGNLDARVEAKLLRNTPVVGRAFSLALWPVSKLFEYQVTGTLGKPKIEPLYILPRLILIPFKPIKTIENLLGDRDEDGAEAESKIPN